MKVLIEQLALITILLLAIIVLLPLGEFLLTGTVKNTIAPVFFCALGASLAGAIWNRDSESKKLLYLFRGDPFLLSLFFMILSIGMGFYLHHRMDIKQEYSLATSFLLCGFWGIHLSTLHDNLYIEFPYLILSVAAIVTGATAGEVILLTVGVVPLPPLVIHVIGSLAELSERHPWLRALFIIFAIFGALGGGERDGSRKSQRRRNHEPAGTPNPNRRGEGPTHGGAINSNQDNDAGDFGQGKSSGGGASGSW